MGTERSFSILVTRYKIRHMRPDVIDYVVGLVTGP
jgi:hypothetical protein